MDRQLLNQSPDRNPGDGEHDLINTPEYKSFYTKETTYSYAGDSPCALCLVVSPDDTIDLKVGKWRRGNVEGSDYLRKLPCCFDCKRRYVRRKWFTKIVSPILGFSLASLAGITIGIFKGTSEHSETILFAIIIGSFLWAVAYAILDERHKEDYLPNVRQWMQEHARKEGEKESGF